MKKKLNLDLVFLDEDLEVRLSKKNYSKKETNKSETENLTFLSNKWGESELSIKITKFLRVSLITLVGLIILILIIISGSNTSTDKNLVKTNTNQKPVPIKDVPIVKTSEKVNTTGVSNSTKPTEPSYEAEVIADVNFRELPNITGNILNVILAGEKVVVNYKITNESGEEWFNVNYNVKQGFISHLAFEYYDYSNQVKVAKETAESNSNNIGGIIGLQKLLNKKISYKYENLESDGIFGLKTYMALRIFQKENNLKPFDGALRDDVKYTLSDGNISESKKVIITPTKKIEENNNTGIFDCGAGGHYNDSFSECFCNTGYGKGSDGKCVAKDCGAGGHYNDSFSECFCNTGYGKGSDGKCYK